MGSLFKSLRGTQPTLEEGPQWVALSMMQQGKQAWFDPKIEGHRRLTTYRTDDPQVSMEFQNLDLLSEAVMEHRRLETSSGKQQQARADFAVLRCDAGPFDSNQAERLASVLNQSRYHKLLMLVMTFQPGALRRLADGLNRSLEMIGLAWLFSKANISDEASLPKEIAYLAEKAEIERLSLLTTRFGSEVDQKLAQALKSVSTLKIAKVCLRDDSGDLPLISTPALDAALASH